MVCYFFLKSSSFSAAFFTSWKGFIAKTSRTRRRSRPVARIFCWGGGGVRTSRIGTQYFNVWMIRYASSENTQGRVTNLQSNWNRDEFKCYRKNLRAAKARASRGVWGHAPPPPQKIFKSESLKMPFPSLSDRKLCQKGSENWSLFSS